MILSEPAPSQGDVHFRLLGFPVRITPFFWVVALIFGIQGKSPPAKVLLWVVAVLVSILIHELGHALLQRKYGGRPRIVLYGMGGLAISGDSDRSSKAQILISLAGPVAGFLFAALIMIGLFALGRHAGVSLGRIDTSRGVPLDGTSIFGALFYWDSLPSYNTTLMIKFLLRINILWGALNLLPIYPLDGGQIAREVCLLSDPRKGMMLSLQISIVCAAAMAVLGLSWGSFFLTLMFGYLAYSSYRALEAYRASLW